MTRYEQEFYRDIKRIADALDNKKCKINPKMKMTKEELTALEEGLDHKGGHNPEWYDLFVDYIQEQSQSMYNEACDYADENSDCPKSNCCGARMLNDRCCKCKEGCVSKCKE